MECDMFVISFLLLCTTVSSGVSSDRNQCPATSYRNQSPTTDTNHEYWGEVQRINSIENIIRQIQTDVSSIKQDPEWRRKIHYLNHTISQIKSVLKYQKKKGENLAVRVENLEILIKEVEEKTTQETSEIHGGLNLIGGEVTLLKSKHSELEDKMMQESDTTFRRGEQLNKNVEDIHSTIARMQKTIDEQRELIETLNRQTSEAQQNLSHVSIKLSEVTKLVKYCERKIPDLDSKLSLNNLTIQEIIANGKLVIILLVVCVCVAVYMYRRRTLRPLTERDTSIPADDTEHREPEKRKDIKQAPVQVTRFTRRTLENSVGVVSFDRHKSDFHKKLIEGLSSAASLSVRVKCTIMTSEDEIQTIPPSKVVFVFVEANSRHIILEDPTQEIGWFRKQIVEALLEMGCDVFVLYVRDEVVEEGSLYHRKLRSVDRHQILSTLKGKNRVLSLNLSFSVYQTTFLVSELQGAFR